jgi:pyruvate formate lyase activating enzyme
MKIVYLQKTSLQDYPDKISCIIFLAGCNFRCPCCYNSDIIDLESAEENYTEEEIIEFLEKRKNKLEGVVITGGEPLINYDISEFLKKIKEIGFLVKMDTNGSNPDLLEEIIEQKLVDYVAMDIKAGKEDYDKFAGVRVDLKKIEKSMNILAFSGIDFEFRTTLCPVKNSDLREINEDDIEKIALWISSISRKVKYYLQPFVPEKNRLLDSRLENEKGTRYETLEKAKKKAEKFLNNVYIRA